MNTPVNHLQQRDTNPGLIIITGIVTLGAVLLAFGAFDDITTDNATTFTVEYAVLVACSCWCFLVAIGLLMKRHILYGLASICLLTGGIWGQRAIGPGTIASLQPEYIVTAVALGWFLVLSIILVVTGFRRLA